MIMHIHTTRLGVGLASISFYANLALQPTTLRLLTPDINIWTSHINIEFTYIASWDMAFSCSHMYIIGCQNGFTRLRILLCNSCAACTWDYGTFCAVPCTALPFVHLDSSSLCSACQNMLRVLKACTCQIVH